MKTNGKPKDKDLLGSLAALKRAARSALTTARNTGTPPATREDCGHRGSTTATSSARCYPPTELAFLVMRAPAGDYRLMHGNMRQLAINLGPRHPRRRDKSAPYDDDPPTLVPFSPGGTSDTLARTLGQRITDLSAHSQEEWYAKRYE